MSTPPATITLRRSQLTDSLSSPLSILLLFAVFVSAFPATTLVLRGSLTYSVTAGSWVMTAHPAESSGL